MQETVLSEGLESTIVVLRHRMPAGVTVVRDHAPDTPSIEAVPGRAEPGVTNLVTNALDAVEGSGTVRLSTRRDSDGVVVEVALREGETVLRVWLPRRHVEG